MHLSLAFLGSFQARLGNELFMVSRAQKIEALLIYLAVESDQPHSRDFLDGLLFPEMPEDGARVNLRQTLARLRRMLQDEQSEVPLLQLDGEVVQFNRLADWELDVRLFLDRLDGCEQHRGKRSPRCPECIAALASGLALYRGPFLEGFVVRECEPFEAWMQRMRDRLQSAALEGYRVLVDYEERRGEYRDALSVARRWLEMDSCNEEAHRLIMRVLARQGQRNAALQQYKRCRQVLMSELGVAPDEETESLASRIRGLTSVRRHNLPNVGERSFVGRQRELGDLRQVLADPERRLLTLLGPGGIGKTRLALETGWAVAQDYFGPFMDGVYFVSLAPEALLTPVSLAMAIIEALEIPLSGGALPETQLIEFLHRKECLLILDNCEVLDNNGRLLISNLLQRTRGVQFLLTSRQRLNLSQEWALEIEGLSYPQQEPAIPNLEPYAAVQLFVQRAQQVESGFALERCGKQEWGSLIEIMQLTEGMPLALELAAAWVRVLSCSEIAGEIRSNLDFLASDMPEIPERHRCIRAVFESSWQMLAEEEQRVLAALSVFSSSFTIEAAEQVAGATRLVLAWLRDKSLLQKEGVEQTRYRLHPLLRQFAAEKLVPEQAPHYNSAHAQHYGHFLAQRREAVDSGEAQTALAEIQVELENVRDGWHWSVEQREIELLGQYMHPLYGFYALRAWWDEGREMFAPAAALGPEKMTYEEIQGSRRALIYSGLLIRLAEFYYSLSQLEQAEALLQRGQAIQHWIEEPEELALAYEKLGLVASRRGDYQRAAQMLEFSHQIAADAGLKNLSAHSLMSLGALARDQGAYSQARVYLTESLTIYRALDYSWGIVNALRLLGYVTYQLRGSDAAQSYYNESLELCQALKNPLIEALVWNSMGQMAHAERKFGEARELYCRAMGLLQERGDDKSLALVFENLGKLELDESQYQAAQTYLEISLEAAVKAQDAGVALRVLVAMARLAVQSGLKEQRQFQIVELLERVSRHPACPAGLRQEALDLLAAVAPNALVPAGVERSWSLLELKPLGYAVVEGEIEAV